MAVPFPLASEHHKLELQICSDFPIDSAMNSLTPKILFALSLLGLAFYSPVMATVFYSKEEAFELAFGVGATVENHPVFLTDEQQKAVETAAKVKVDSQFFTFFEGHRNGQLLGYAAIEAHTVRTQPETLLVVLSPEGALVKAEILAFHEPPEYKPSAAWFETLIGKPRDQLRPGEGVDGITGATLSVRATLDSIRKVQALHQLVLMKEGG